MAGLARTCAVLGLLAACRMSADYGETAYRCPTGECPGGQECVEGVCVPLGPGGAAAATAPPDGPVEPVPDGAVADGPVFDAPPLPPPDAPPPPPVDGAPLPDAGWPPNLCPNPGTEAGPLVDWTPYLSTHYEVTSNVHGGTKAIKVCKDDTGGTSFMSAYVDVINPAEPGEIPLGGLFRAYLWVRASTLAGDVAPPQLTLTIREAGGLALRGDHDGPPLMPVTTAWTLVTAEGVIDEPDRTRITLIISPGDVPDGTCYVFDDAYTALFP